MNSSLYRKLACLAIFLGGTAFAQEANSPSDLLSDLKTNAWGLPGYSEVEVLTPPPSTPDSVEEGRQLAETYCISCHGIKLAGEGYDESVTLNPPRSLRNTGNYHLGYMDLSVFRTIKYGIPKLMDSFEEPMTDEQIWALTSYVRSLQNEN